MMSAQPSTYRAVTHTPGLSVHEAASFRELELPLADLPADRLWVRVEAVSVNPIDTKLRRLAAPPEQGDHAVVLGFDAAATVVDCGSATQGYAPGDHIWYSGCVGQPGCHAEFQAVDPRWVAPRPSRLTPAAAACLPLCGITAWEALFDRLGIDAEGGDAGRRLLIIGGAGGVGSVAIQLAHRLAGLEVYATASRPASRLWCLSLGARHVLDHGVDLQLAARALHLAAFDYILCCAEPSAYFTAMCELLAPEGSICALVDAASPLPMNALKRKSGRFVWEFMFTRVLFPKAQGPGPATVLSRLAALVDQGALVSPLQRHLGTLSAASLREAHALLESGRMVGKLALDGFPSRRANQT